jgi:hypothetical protein
MDACTTLEVGRVEDSWLAQNLSKHTWTERDSVWKLVY